MDAISHKSATSLEQKYLPPAMIAMFPQASVNSPLVVRLDKFDKKIGLDRGKPFWFEMLWYVVKCWFFLSPWPWGGAFKRRLLILFGAKIGMGFVIRPRVNIHMPWKFAVGDHCWIGEGCEFLSLETITLHDHVALGHRVYLAAGSHDYTEHTMPYKNGPITIGRGSWIASCAFIGPDVVVGEHSVIGAGSVVTRSIPPFSVAYGNPCKVVKQRVLKK